MAVPRALHFVFKVADRTKTIRFYKDVLGMKVLRHEEFEEGCKAACNGPYDGRWSKTMIGYGAEDRHFVLELTYNYGIKNYARGNDLQRVVVHSREVVARARGSDWPQQTAADGAVVLEAPGGYPFHLYEQDSVTAGPVFAVTLSVSQLSRSLDFWAKVLGMSIYERNDSKALLGYGDKQARLELASVDGVEHAEAFGRIAFACPSADLAGVEERAGGSEGKVLTPLVSLDTPGKATVQVVILGSPDGHEICFVGEEAFSQLSQVDPGADKLLSDAIAADKSDEWFAKRAKKQ